MESNQLVAGLDIGSTKVAVVIGNLTQSGIDVVGVGTAPNQALKKGVVVNIEATTEAIQKAREEAELMAGVELSKVWVGVAGSHLKSFDSKGIIAIRGQDVTATDVDRVIEAAKTVAVPQERQVLHALARDFKLDDQDGIFDPVGMSGVRLEASVHIVTGGKTALQNIIKCAERANLKVIGTVLEPLASSLAVLEDDEKKLGTALIDMGGGTTDLVIYIQGNLAYTASVPVGGIHVTNDLAMGLRTPQISAENLKKKYGCALAALIDSEETIEVEGVGGRPSRAVLRRNLCEVIEPRIEETFEFVKQEIEKSGLSQLIGSGIVLTGGGSQLDGVTELGEFIFDMPIRKATPNVFGGMIEAVRAPSFSTALGLVTYGSLQEREWLKSRRRPAGQVWMSRIKDWIDEIL